MDLYIFSMCDADNLSYYDFASDGNLVRKSVITVPVPMYGYIIDERMYIALRGPFGEAQSGVMRIALSGGFPKLTESAILPCEGRIACHLSVSPDERFLYTANYRSGNLSEFELNKEGEIVDLHNVLQFPKINEESVPHAHGIFFSRDGKELYAPDLGSDRIWVYSMEENGAALKEEFIPVPPLSGPRHLAISKNGEYAFLVCQNSNTVHMYSLDQGKWHETSCVKTVMAGEIKNQSSAIRLSDNEKWLFVSNRGGNTVSMIRIDGTQLKLIWNEPCGSNPRDMDLSPDGKWLVLGNMDQDQVAVYEIDYRSGRLKTHTQFDLPCPVAVLFRR